MKHEIVKFLVVGIANTLLGYTVYFICLIFLQFHYVYALLCSHVVGVINSYLLNSNWTFRSSQNYKWVTILKFCSVYSITFLINYAVLAFFIDYLSHSELISQFYALMITTICSFGGHKYWSFNKRLKEQKDA